MKNQIFGSAWEGTGAAESLESVPTPVGEACLHCEEAVAEGDSGIIQALLEEKGWRPVATHRECFLRHVFGSVAHQQGHAPGKPCVDDPALTKREAARAAVGHWESTRGVKP